jgi:DNA-directed RNA polymerase subunit RPC12/RpoP
MGSPMTHTTADQPHTRTIKCPVCHSHGANLHHDIRSSLLYFCQRCEHEWEIDRVEEPLDVDPAISPGPLRGSRSRRGQAPSAPRRLE